MLPKNILYDKETLYEEVWKSKELINKLNEDLKKMKIDNENLERQVRNYEEIIQEKDKINQNLSTMQQTVKSPPKNEQSKYIPNQMINHTSLINLKAQIKEYQKQANQKSNEINILKKDSRTTHLQELEMEVNQLRDECKRLINYIKIKFNQDQQETKTIENSLLFDHEQHTLVTQKNLINAYKQDNIYLSTMIQKLEEEKSIYEVISISNLQTKNKTLDREIQKALYNQKSSEKQVKELNSHLSFLRADLVNNSSGNRKLSTKQENEVLKKALQQQTEDNQNLNHQLVESQKKISELEIRQRDQEQEYQIMRNLEMKEKEKLHERMQNLRKENDRLEKMCERDEDEDDAVSQFMNELIPDTKRSLAKDSLTRPSIRVQQSQQSFSSQDLLLRRNSKLNQIKRKLPRVNHYDIKNCCKELKFRLMICKVDFSMLEDLIVSQTLSFEEQVSINQISEALKNEPFNLEEVDQIHFLSRYLVEDNLEEFVMYDPLRTQDKAIVKSVFKKLIEQYIIFDQSEQISFDNYFANLFNKWQVSIDSTLKQLLVKKKYLQQGYCEQEDLDGAFNFCDIQLLPRQKEYLDIKMYQDSNSLNLINIHKLFDYYKQIFEANKQDLNEVWSTKIIPITSETAQDLKIQQTKTQEQLEHDDPEIKNFYIDDFEEQGDIKTLQPN